MAERVRRSERESATGEAGADAIGGAYRQVAQGLANPQETLRHKDERAERRLQEAVARLEQQLQQKDAAIRALQQRLDALENARTTEGPGGEGALARLEGRMEKVEASLQSAMQKFFPKVESLLRQLEETPLPGTASVSTVSSVSASTSISVSAPSSASSSASVTTSSVSRPRAAGGAASEEEQRQRERVERRVREVEERARNAQDAPCPLGEALWLAAKKGRLEEVRRLLDSGANVNYTNGDGKTPLTYAVLGNPKAAVVSLIMVRGADVNAVNINGSSALHLAALNDRSGRCVELLVGAGADVNARRIDGLTPLHWAADWNNEAAVRALLAAGARRELRGWSGAWDNKTPLDFAKAPAVREILRR